MIFRCRSHRAAARMKGQVNFKSGDVNATLLQALLTGTASIAGHPRIAPFGALHLAGGGAVTGNAYIALERRLVLGMEIDADEQRRQRDGCARPARRLRADHALVDQTRKLCARRASRSGHFTRHRDSGHADGRGRTRRHECLFAELAVRRVRARVGQPRRHRQVQCERAADGRSCRPTNRCRRYRSRCRAISPSPRRRPDHRRRRHNSAVGPTCPCTG